MPYYFTDPSRELRECPACRGDGKGARINAGIPAGRADGPGLVQLIPNGCRICGGTGRLGDPHAVPEVEVFHSGEMQWSHKPFEYRVNWYNKPGFYYAYGSYGVGGAFLWSRRPVGPYSTESDALAAAREGE